MRWAALLITWALLGLGYSAGQRPSDRLLWRSAHAEDRPAVFAAPLALSHDCWLGATLPLATLAPLFGAATLLAVVVAAKLWPASSADALPHDHPELPPNHPHLAKHTRRHSHVIVIDDLRPS